MRLANHLRLPPPFKNGKCQLLKMAKSHYIVILIKRKTAWN